MNPYEPASQDIDERPTFTLGALLIVTAWVAMMCASWVWFGSQGLAPAAAIVAISLFLISQSRAKRLHPLNQAPLGLSELLVLLTICAILHGLTIPAVPTLPRR